MRSESTPLNLRRHTLLFGIISAMKTEGESEAGKLLETAKRLIDDSASSSKQIKEGAGILKELTEGYDCLEAWQYLLDCHERGIGPFKTNKFRRSAKAAIERLAFLQEMDLRAPTGDSTDFSWCTDKRKQEAVMHIYAEARHKRDKFIEERVRPLVSQEKFTRAARRIGLDWNKKNALSDSEAFAVLEFTFAYDDSCGYIPIDRGIRETKRGLDHDYDVAMDMLGRLRYTWSTILDTKPRCGLICRDMLTGEEFFLFERNLSTSAFLKGATIACGRMPVGNYFMHNGFSVPIPEPDAGNESTEEMLDGILSDLKIDATRPVVLTKTQTASLAAVSIRSFLYSGLADFIRFV